MLFRYPSGPRLLGRVINRKFYWPCPQCVHVLVIVRGILYEGLALFPRPSAHPQIHQRRLVGRLCVIFLVDNY